MKKSLATLLTLLTLLLTTSYSYSQDFTGSWIGTLKTPTGDLRVTFNVTNHDNIYTTTMDSPDQGAYGIPTTSTKIDTLNIEITIKDINVRYYGTLKENKIDGTFSQNGQNFPLILDKNTKKITINRPQEPKPPYTYNTEEVIFKNTEAGITLAGTLTTPKTGSKFPAVIMISGSGAQNRDEEILGHKPFFVIADYLTKNGIAVLRYDDRGVGKSTGDYTSATSVDLATDALSAVRFLTSRKDIDSRKIGLIGHSEGGMIAPMVALKSADVSFIVMMAGTGVSGDSILLMQQDLILRAANCPEPTISQSHAVNSAIYKAIKDTPQNQDISAIVKKAIKQASPTTTDKDIDAMIPSINTPWMRYFISYDPAIALRKLNCPVLALNGSKDLQVPMKENIAAIKDAVKPNKLTVIEFENLNHLFQECTTGLPAEYGKIEQTISPKVLSAIKDWILKITK